MSVRLLIGDCRERLRELEAESVHTCVTSPPYFGLRDYGVDGQIGLEATPDAFVRELVDVFREVRRVLRKDGTVWLNLGDSYASAPGQATRGGAPSSSSTLEGNGHRGGGPKLAKLSRVGRSGNKGHPASDHARRPFDPRLKPKDLIGIPWRVAFALQDDGWYLRQDIIWAKPNPMPESVTDRCTKAHEYLFLLAKSPRYYYDAEAISEGLAVASVASVASVARLAQNVEAQQGSERVPGKTNGTMKAVGRRRAPGNKTHKGATAYEAGATEHRTKVGLVAFAERERDKVAAGDLIGTRNRRSVWTVATQPFKEAHFATYPPALIEPCILAGSPALCCGKCGAPVERQTKRVDSGFDGSKYGERAVAASGGAATGGAAKSTLGSNNGRATGKRETMGFAPTCRCAADFVPGTVLDPFGGAGTTGLVADRLQRNAVLIELNPAYAEIARKRLEGDAGMFSDVEAA